MHEFKDINVLILLGLVEALRHWASSRCVRA